MKKQFFPILLFSAILLNACSNNSEDPQPSGGTLQVNGNSTARYKNFVWTNSSITGNWNDSHFLDQNTGYHVGAGGAVIKTTNGGTSYSSTTNPTSQDLFAVYFLSSNDGFVAGNNNAFYKTTNGGTSWSAVTLPTLPTVHFREIYFFNSSIGFLGGGNGTLLKTTDGGITWSLSNTGMSTTIGAIYSVLFYDANNGLASTGFGTIYKTTDGGANWSSTMLHTGTSVLLKLDKLNGVPPFDTTVVTTAIANPSANEKTTYFYTVNHGTSWTKVEIPGTYKALCSVKLLPNTRLLAGGSYGANTGTVFFGPFIRLGDTWLPETGVPTCGRLTNLSAIQTSASDVVVFTSGLSNTVLKGE